MSEKVQQLCQSIAKHPSKINMINEVIAHAVKNPNCHDFGLIVQLI